MAFPSATKPGGGRPGFLILQTLPCPPGSPVRSHRFGEADGRRLPIHGRGRAAVATPEGCECDGGEEELAARPIRPPPDAPVEGARPTAGCVPWWKVGLTRRFGRGIRL